MGDQQRKVLQPLPLGQMNAHGIGRSRGLKAHAEEDHLLVGVLDGEVDGIERRVDDADVGAAGLQ